MSAAEKSPPQSLNQEFLYAFDKGEQQGAFGDRHTLVYGWRVRGTVDTATLSAALADVVVRHEILRTSLEVDGDIRYQKIHPASPAGLRELALDPDGDRDDTAEALLNTVDAEPFPAARIPHLGAVLGRFDGDDAVLVLAAHHVATDPWSIGLIAQDLAECYAARRDGMSPAAWDGGQYRDYAEWQRAPEAAETTAPAAAYWRTHLDGARILGVPVDRIQPPGQVNTYAVHRFLLDRDLTGRTTALARSAHCSPFMVLLAAYCLLLRRTTGRTDIVVPTFTAGRYQDRFTRVVGPFYNFVPLRVDLAGCDTFRDVVVRARTTCIEAYRYDIPFTQILAEAPDLVATFADPGLAVAAFELLQSPASFTGDKVGDLVYTEIRRRVRSQDVSSQIPDGALWAIDVLPSGELAAGIKFNPNVFDRETWVRTAAEFAVVLTAAVADPDGPLSPAASGAAA